MMRQGTATFGNMRRWRHHMQRAIQRLDAMPNDSLELSASSSQPLLHRLRLAELEIERQREELRRAETSLENSRARFIDLLVYTSTLYNQAPVGYLTLSTDRRIVEANLTAVTLLGTRRELLLHQPIIHFIIEDDQTTFLSFYRELLESPQAQRCEVRMVRVDGTILYVQIDGIVTPSMWGHEDVASARLEDSSAVGTIRRGPYIRITLSDITDRVALEIEERRVRTQLETTLHDLHQTQEQLVKQERMAVVGQLVAGIAHDFNNIMASITLYAQLLMRAAELPDSLQKRIEAILSQSNRAADLVQQMLDFSRRTVMARQSTALTGFLQQFAEMLQPSLPDTIQISFDSALEAGIDDIADVDPGRIQQVLLNLALNARDAMPDGGTLRLSLSRVQVEEPSRTVASGTLAPGSWLRLELTDTGHGIDPEALPHLFEPFFTTKEIGEGSGLGLSQVWGLVKQHDGEIDVTSEIGKGTTFTIYLPVSSTAPVLSPPLNTDEVPYGRGEVVLVVEDSDFLRAAVISVLTQLGYQTLAAGNGQEGFDLMIQEGDKIDLILTDLSMPVMGGKELIRAVRAQRWKHPIVVLTGQPLSESEIVQLESYGQVSRLQKPVVMERLAVTLSQALHA